MLKSAISPIAAKRYTLSKLFGKAYCCRNRMCEYRPLCPAKEEAFKELHISGIKLHLLGVVFAVTSHKSNFIVVWQFGFVAKIL